MYKEWVIVIWNNILFKKSVCYFFSVIFIGDRKFFILGIDKDSIFGVKSYRDFVYVLKRFLIDIYFYVGDVILIVLVDRMKKERMIMVEKIFESLVIE